MFAAGAQVIVVHVNAVCIGTAVTFSCIMACLYSGPPDENGFAPAATPADRGRACRALHAASGSWPWAAAADAACASMAGSTRAVYLARVGKMVAAAEISRARGTPLRSPIAVITDTAAAALCPPKADSAVIAGTDAVAAAQAAMERVMAFKDTVGGRAMHRCPACGSDDVLVTSLTTRSADEGARTQCKCRDCGESFGFNA